MDSISGHDEFISDSIPVFGSKPRAKNASAVGKNKLTLQQRIEIINGIISEGLRLFSILSGDFWFCGKKFFKLMFHLGGGARFD